MLTQLSHAHAEGRVLFTHDSDHPTLSAQGFEHSGIAFCHQRKRGPGEIIAGPVLIWELVEPDEIRNRVECLSSVRILQFRRSNLEQQPLGVLDPILDLHQKADGLAPINQTMIIR
jgi:hypothetical protein